MSEIIVPETWRDRIEDLFAARRHAWLVAAVVAVVAIAAWVMSDAKPAAQIAPPATSASTEGEGATVVVHVAGHVVAPGVYEMSPSARVADAIAAAGGPRRKADLDALNLAELVADGMKIEVPRRSAPGAVAASPPAGSQTTPAAPVVDLNSADQAALESIPGVGPVTALAILQYRESAGSFTSIDQLLEVRGIGPATLEAIRPYVTL